MQFFIEFIYSEKIEDDDGTDDDMYTLHVELLFMWFFGEIIKNKNN
jgi:hypothetical protein